MSGASGSNVQTGHFEGISEFSQGVDTLLSGINSKCPGAPVFYFTVASGSPSVSSYPLTASFGAGVEQGPSTLTAGQASLVLWESGPNQDWWSTGGSVSVTQTSVQVAGGTVACMDITFSNIPMAPATGTAGANPAMGTFTISGSSTECSTQ